jgi:hypothetical protein
VIGKCRFALPALFLLGSTASLALMGCEESRECNAQLDCALSEVCSLATGRCEPKASSPNRDSGVASMDGGIVEGDGGASDSGAMNGDAGTPGSLCFNEFSTSGVHLFGSLASPSRSTPIYGFANISRPPQYVLWHTGRVGASGRLIYEEDGEYFEYRCEVPPADFAPENNFYSLSEAQQDSMRTNDVFVRSSLCPFDNVVDFRMDLDGEIYERCGNSQDWIDSNGKVVWTEFDGFLINAGVDGYLLALSRGDLILVDTARSGRSVVQGLPMDRSVEASRAVSDGFWVALFGKDANPAGELWTVTTTGTVNLMGRYAARPEGRGSADDFAIDGAGDFYSTRPSFPGKVYRFALNGPTSPVFEDVSDTFYCERGCALRSAGSVSQLDYD